MSDLVVAPMAVAFVTAVGCLAGRHHAGVRRAVSALGMLAFAGVVAALDARVLAAPAHTLTYQVGGWPAPFGIVLVADALAAFFLTLTAAVALPSLFFAFRDLAGYGERFFHPLFAFLLLGVSGAFLTGDLFDLFVWFEVTLMASYALVAFRSGRAESLAAGRYLLVNLVGSALMLVAIGGLYGVLGTLNVADMARRLADPAAYGVDPLPVLGLSLLLLVVFALKAGLVPLHWWVPSVYAAAPPPAAAMLAGVVKKVGVYAILRFVFVVLSAADLPVRVTGHADALDAAGVLLIAMAAGSVLLGGLAAVDRDTLEGTFAYSSVGQVGFVALPLGVAALVPAVREAGVLAALVYALAHGLAKPLLFLLTGTVRDATGTTDLDELTGIAGRSPVLAAAFLVGGLSLVGVPPLAGFFAKLAVFRAALAVPPALAVAVGGALLTIAYVTRTWNRAFWGAQSPQVETAAVDPVRLAAVLALALGVLAVGLGYEPVLSFARLAAHTATAGGRDAYVHAVLGGVGA